MATRTLIQFPDVYKKHQTFWLWSIHLTNMFGCSFYFLLFRSQERYSWLREPILQEWGVLQMILSPEVRVIIYYTTWNHALINCYSGLTIVVGFVVDESVAEKYVCKNSYCKAKKLIIFVPNLQEHFVMIKFLFRGLKAVQYFLGVHRNIYECHRLSSIEEKKTLLGFTSFLF